MLNNSSEFSGGLLLFNHPTFHALLFVFFVCLFLDKLINHAHVQHRKHTPELRITLIIPRHLPLCWIQAEALCNTRSCWNVICIRWEQRSTSSEEHLQALKRRLGSNFTAPVQKQCLWFILLIYFTWCFLNCSIISHSVSANILQRCVKICTLKKKKNHLWHQNCKIINFMKKVSKRSLRNV